MAREGARQKQPKRVWMRAAGFGPFHVEGSGHVVRRAKGKHQEGIGRREAVRILERRKL
jgi:hypothetical protein